MLRIAFPPIEEKEPDWRMKFVPEPKQKWYNSMILKDNFSTRLILFSTSYAIIHYRTHYVHVRLVIKGLATRDDNGAGLGRVHLDPDPFIFHRPRPAPNSLGLDFSDPDSLGLAGPWVLTGS